jgi:tight adherence protein C
MSATLGDLGGSALGPLGVAALGGLGGSALGPLGVAALGTLAIVPLVFIVAAATRKRRQPARPARRSPRLAVAGPVPARSVAPPVPPTQVAAPSPTGRRGPLPPRSVPVAAPTRRLRRMTALAIAGAVGAVGVSPVAGKGSGLLVLSPIAGVLVVRRAADRRAASKLRAERAVAAPAVIDLLGACLLAGLNPYRSLVRVAERSPAALRVELARAAAELDLGRTPAAALRAVGERTSLDELRAAAAALEAAERWGAPPAEALAARAEALRSRARLRAEAEAGRAAVRLAFPLVFCFLPAFVLLVVVPTMAGALRVLAP